MSGAAPVLPPMTPPPVPPPGKEGGKSAYFRWKNIGRASAATGLALIFAVFFLDWTVKAALEKAGTAANGAKVEMGGVKINLLGLRVALSDLQVTDAGDPMTNALEVGRMTFKLAPKPLFWKKVIIEDASIEDIRTGTPRRTSGALPKKEKAPERKTAEKPSAGASLLAGIKDKFDPKKIAPEDLESYKKIKEEQVHWSAAAESWQTRVEAVKLDDREKEVKAFVDRVKSEHFTGLEGLKKAKELLKDGKKLKDDLDSTKKGFDAVKKDLNDDIARARTSLQEIEELKKKDVDGALGGLKDAFSAEGIVRGLVGPAWTGKIGTGLEWFHKIRALVPQKKKAEKEPPPPPRTGKDLSFPFKYNWPAFLLEKASLSGETPGGLAYGGTLKDVTSDPKKLGRPITVELAGSKGAESLSLRGELDYTHDAARERVRLSYGGIPLMGIKLGEVAGGPVGLTKGAGKAVAELEAREEDISGRIDFNADPIALSHAAPADRAGDKLASALHDVLSGVKKLEVAFLVSGKVSAPEFKIRSSLDDQLGGALKAAVQKQVDELRAQVLARVNALAGDEQKKLSQLVDGRAGDAAKKLGLKDKQIQSAQDQIQKALGDLAGKQLSPLGTGGGKPNLKKLFK